MHELKSHHELPWILRTFVVVCEELKAGEQKVGVTINMNLFVSVHLLVHGASLTVPVPKVGDPETNSFSDHSAKVFSDGHLNTICWIQAIEALLLTIWRKVMILAVTHGLEDITWVMPRPRSLPTCHGPQYRPSTFWNSHQHPGIIWEPARKPLIQNRASSQASICWPQV